MAYKPIVDEHHVVRHCKKRNLVVRDDKIVDIFPEAFLLREDKDETYLSANYVEYFAGSRDVQIKSCLSDLHITPKPKDGLMRLNVGEMKSAGLRQNVKLQVLHKGGTSSSYSGIFGMPRDPQDRVLASLLASLAKNDTRQISAI
jgi:hypothetical protein